MQLQTGRDVKVFDNIAGVERDVVTRDEARALGLVRYFPGVPCARGHIDERNTRAGYCSQCVRDRQHVWNAQDRRENPAKWAAYSRPLGAKRRAAKLQATPAWADLAAIKAVYAEAVRLETLHGTPYHVDHIVPLQGATVCGLHVHANLQVLPGPENSSKGARRWPDMP